MEEEILKRIYEHLRTETSSKDILKEVKFIRGILALLTGMEKSLKDYMKEYQKETKQDKKDKTKEKKEMEKKYKEFKKQLENLGDNIKGLGKDVVGVYKEYMQKVTSAFESFQKNQGVDFESAWNELNASLRGLREAALSQGIFGIKQLYEQGKITSKQYKQLQEELVAAYTTEADIRLSQLSRIREEMEDVGKKVHRRMLDIAGAEIASGRLSEKQAQNLRKMILMEERAKGTGMIITNFLNNIDVVFSAGISEIIPQLQAIFGIFGGIYKISKKIGQTFFGKKPGAPEEMGLKEAFMLSLSKLLGGKEKKETKPTPSIPRTIPETTEIIMNDISKLLENKEKEIVPEVVGKKSEVNIPSGITNVKIVESIPLKVIILKEMEARAEKKVIKKEKAEKEEISITPLGWEELPLVEGRSTYLNIKEPKFTPEKTKEKIEKIKEEAEGGKKTPSIDLTKEIGGLKDTIDKIRNLNNVFKKMSETTSRTSYTIETGSKVLGELGETGAKTGEAVLGTTEAMAGATSGAEAMTGATTAAGVGFLGTAGMILLAVLVFVAIIVIVVGFIIAIKRHWNSIKKIFSTIVEGVGSALKSVAYHLTHFLANLGRFLQGLIKLNVKSGNEIRKQKLAEIEQKEGIVIPESVKKGNIIAQQRYITYHNTAVAKYIQDWEKVTGKERELQMYYRKLKNEGMSEEEINKLVEKKAKELKMKPIEREEEKKLEDKIVQSTTGPQKEQMKQLQKIEKITKETGDKQIKTQEKVAKEKEKSSIIVTQTGGRMIKEKSGEKQIKKTLIRALNTY